MPTPVNPPVQPDSSNPSPFKPQPQPTPAIPQPKGDDGPLFPSVLDGLKSFWLAVRGNPFLVAFEGGVIGALFNFIDEGVNSGSFDLSRHGFHKLLVASLIGGVSAVRLLYRPVPGTNPRP
jgi:hypothetical protein